MKNFNTTIFLLTTIIMGLLIIPSFKAAFAEDEGTLNPKNTFWSLFARLYYIIRFPTHTLLSPIISAGGIITFFGGLFINCVFYGLVVEIIVSVFRKKSK